MNHEAGMDAADRVLTRVALWLFISFAFAYFFSALLRGVTATLAPNFSAELGLGAGELGLLVGAFFLGFALTQLPLGSALDRFGPRRVMVVLLLAAVLGCVAFASARTFVGLTFASLIGVSACLMVSMTTFRRRFTWSPRCEPTRDVDDRLAGNDPTRRCSGCRR
jgi:MFS family permease